MIYDIERCVGFKIELIDVNQNLRRLSEQFTLITDCILHGRQSYHIPPKDRNLKVCNYIKLLNDNTDNIKM